MIGSGTNNRLNLTIDGVLDGGATVGGDAVNLQAATVSGVQTLAIRNVTTSVDAADIMTVSAANFVGLTNFIADRSTAAITAVTNLAAGAAVSVNGNATVTNGAVDARYTTASSAITLNLTNGVRQAAAVGAIDFSAATTATAIINSTGASNVVGGIDLGGGTANLTSLIINAATSLTISDGGAGAEILGWLAGGTANTLTISGAATTVTTGNLAAVNIGLIGTELDVVNAAGMTAGGVELTISAVTQVITGGAGTDTITTGGTQTGAVDAGGGSADRLIVATATDIAATPGAKFTNFEILRNATNNDLNVSTVVGITSIELSGGGGATNMTAGQAAAITNLANSDTLTLALTTATGTSDVLAVTLANTTATTSADLTTATITGFETMNVVSSSGSSADISALSFAAAANLGALNITGARPISVTTTNLTKSGGTAINASGVTYTSSTATDFALTITGDLVKGSVVTGTSAIDSITTTAAIAGTSGEFVTYNAGNGNDAISTTIAAINNTSAANGSLQINGGDGTDTLTTTDTGGTMVDANFQYLTNIERITIGDDGAAVSITSGGFFNTNFATSILLTSILGDDNEAITMNLGTYTGNATLVVTSGVVGNSATDALLLTTGSGTDTVTVSATSFVGAAATPGTIVISTGAGVDTISLTIAATLADDNVAVVSIQGGLGADIISVTGVNGAAGAATNKTTAFIVGAGESTTTAWDQVTGFVKGDGTDMSSTLDFASAALNQYAATAATGFTAGELTVAVSTTGVVTFAGTAAATLTLAQQISAVQSVVTANAGDSAVWVNGTSTYVFNNNTAGDSIVQLVGVSGTVLLTTGGTEPTSTNNGIYII